MQNQTENQNVLHYFILSDSIGETAVKLVKSILAQFPTVEAKLHRYTFISDPAHLKRILEKANRLDALVYMTIADIELAHLAEDFCIDTGLICYNLIQPYALEISRRTGVKPSEISGAQHELDDQYFNRVKAMEFAASYDDGKNANSLEEADIVILGVSRTGKTPLCMYLAVMGYKAMNLPLIPENDLPDLLFEIDQSKIIGLTNDPDILNKHRLSRMREYGMSESSRYSSHDRILNELEYADEIYRQLGCPVINVADRSIEESASIILDIMNLPVTWH